jgi:arylsulfatase A-like enzyme
MRVLYIDLDCCRPDHLGCNGYLRDTSPNLDRIAREGVTFTHCYCANSPCVPSRASLFLGRHGFNTGVVAHHGVGEQFRERDVYRGHWRDMERPTLPMQLWQQGMKTVTFSCFHDRHNAWWFTAGWEEIHTFTRKRGQERADEVNAAFLPWLREHGREDNWFVHLHFWDIHSYYRLPAEWAGRFHGQPGPDWPDQATIDRQQSFYGPRSAVDLYTGYETLKGGGRSRPAEYMPDAIRTQEDFRLLIDAYDAAIAYADRHVGQVLDLLDELGVLEDTAVVVSGDHGDSFGEHGQYMDHGIANEAVHNIPMIVRWPGVTTRPGRCDAMIYGMDLGPTLCELLGMPTPSRWDGRSFAAALRGEAFAGWPYQVWDHGIYTFTRAVRTPEWLMIRVLHPGLYPYDDPVMLHDMRADPHQTLNLAGEQPQMVGELSALMEQWRQEQIRKGGAPDPLEQMVSEGPFLYYTPEQMFARLEATGRAHVISELKARLNRYHPERYR